MSDPRARITNARRELTTRPPTAAPDVVTVLKPPPASVGSTTVPGKRHGRKRSIGLHLPGPTCDAIRRAAAHDGATLADIVLTAIERSGPQVTNETGGALFPARQRRLRTNLDRPQTLFILLTPSEAETLASLAEKARTSMSALVTEAVANDVVPGREQPARDSRFAIGRVP
jgi:uncharacterized protein (DUF1778 family)